MLSLLRFRILQILMLWHQDAIRYAALAGAYVMKAGGALVAQIEQGPAGIRFLCFLGSSVAAQNLIDSS